MTALVFQTGQPARLDDHGKGAGPISVDPSAASDPLRGGRSHQRRRPPWGVMIAAACDERLPLTSRPGWPLFTQLVGTAISNAETKAQLIVSRARIVGTADATRRRIERDLHDSVQQHLISLALTLRTAQAAAPPAARELAERLDGVIDGMGGVIDELREISRGIHPPALVQGGLHPALKIAGPPLRRSGPPRRADRGQVARADRGRRLLRHRRGARPMRRNTRRPRSSMSRSTSPDGMLRVRVCDNGSGGANPAEGSGLVGLQGPRRSARRAGVAGEPGWGRDDAYGPRCPSTDRPRPGSCPREARQRMAPAVSSPAGCGIAFPNCHGAPLVVRLPTRVPLSRHSVRAARRPSVSRNSRIWTQPTSSTGSSPRGQITTGI